MIKRHCDRCEAITGENNTKGLPDGIIIIKIDSLRKDILSDGLSHRDFSLCSDCLNSLIDWIKPIVLKDKTIVGQEIPDPATEVDDVTA